MDTTSIRRLTALVETIASHEKSPWKYPGFSKKRIPEPGHARLDPDSLQGSNPPIAVHRHFVGRLKRLAKALSREGGISHAEALEFTARRAGFDHWKHVTVLAEAYERSVVDSFQHGCVVFARVPSTQEITPDQSAWQRDSRAIYEAASFLEGEYYIEGYADGPEIAGSAVDFLRIVGANEYSDSAQTMLPGEFFRLVERAMPANFLAPSDAVRVFRDAFGISEINYVWLRGEFTIVKSAW